MSNKPATAPPSKEEFKGQSWHINHQKGMYSDPTGHTFGPYPLPPEKVLDGYVETYVGYKKPEAEEKVVPVSQDE